MKRILSMVLALVMALSLCTSAWAEETVNNETDLKNAISAAGDGDIITLGGDIDLTQNPLSISGKLTLDLAGHTIKQTATGDDGNGVNAIYLEGNANVTITSTGSAGSIIGTKNGISMNDTNGGEKLTITNVNVTGTNNGIWSCGELTINSGKITATNYNGINNVGGTVNIAGGELTGGYAYNAYDQCTYYYNGIYTIGSNSAVTVSDGIVNKLYIDEQSEVTINGGEINGYCGHGSENDGFTITGGVINGDVFAKSISGGTFNGKITLVGAGNYNQDESDTYFKNCKINGELTWGNKTTAPTTENIGSNANITFGENASIAQSGKSENYIIDNGEVKQSANVKTLTVKSEDTDKGTIEVAWKQNDTKKATNVGSVKGNLISKETLTVWANVTAKDPYVFDGWYLGEDAGAGKATDMTTGKYTNGYTTYTYQYSTTVSDNIALVARFKLSEEAEAANKFLTDKSYTSAQNIEISSTNDMKNLAYAVAFLDADFSGKTVKLANDLTYTADDTYYVIGSASAAFKGTFDGQNHTISGIRADKVVRLGEPGGSTKTDTYAGLFARLNSAMVKNLKLEDCSFTDSYTRWTYSGGIAGDAQNSQITDCTISGVTTLGWFGGSVIGHTFGGVTVSNVTVTGCTTMTENQADQGKGGAITGYAEGITIKNVTVSDVKSGAALIGHINARGENAVKISGAIVNASGAYLFGTKYEGTGSVSISDAGQTAAGDLKTNIAVKGILSDIEKNNGGATIAITGGHFINCDPSEYVPTGYQTVRFGKVYAVVQNGATDSISDTFSGGTETVKVTAETSGSNVTCDPAAKYKAVKVGRIWVVVRIEGETAVENTDGSVTEIKVSEEGTTTTATEITKQNETEIKKVVTTASTGGGRTVIAVVEINGKAATTVEGVYTAAVNEAKKTDNAENDYKLKLTVENATTATVNAQQAITQKAGSGVKLEFKDIDLTEYVDNDAVGTELRESSVVLAVTVPFDTSRRSIKVYRNHEGTVTQFTQLGAVPADGSARDGTFFIGSNELVIYTNKFSTYAISYTEPSSRHYYYSGTAATTADGKTVNSAKTFDAGVGVYAVTAVLSVTGMAWVARKRGD